MLGSSGLLGLSASQVSSLVAMEATLITAKPGRTYAMANSEDIRELEVFLQKYQENLPKLYKFPENLCISRRSVSNATSAIFNKTGLFERLSLPNEFQMSNTGV